jgi:hypothetical protein
MRRVLAALVFALLALTSPLGGQAGPALFGIPGGLEAFAKEDITIGAVSTRLTVLTFTPVNAPSAKAAVCQFETANLRYWYDGSDPTTTSGFLVTTTDTYPLVVVGINNITRWRGIRTTGVSALGHCTYLR